MNLHRDNGSDEPCRHMEGMLNKVADGSAGATTTRYVLAHVLRCDRCRRFLESLKAMIGQLRKARSAEPSAAAEHRMLAQYRAEMAKSEERPPPPS